MTYGSYSIRLVLFICLGTTYDMWVAPCPFDKSKLTGSTHFKTNYNKPEILEIVSKFKKSCHFLVEAASGGGITSGGRRGRCKTWRDSRVAACEGPSGCRSWGGVFAGAANAGVRGRRWRHATIQGHGPCRRCLRWRCGAERVALTGSVSGQLHVAGQMTGRQPSRMQ